MEQVQKLHFHVSKLVLMKGLVVRSLLGAARRDVIPQLEKKKEKSSLFPTVVFSSIVSKIIWSNTLIETTERFEPLPVLCSSYIVNTVVSQSFDVSLCFFFIPYIFYRLTFLCVCPAASKR